MRIALIGLAGLSLAGCTASMAGSGQAATAPAAGCDASRAESFAGKPGDAIAEEARIAAGANGVRVIRPGQAVTMDYRADRLNIELDDAGTVVKVRCG